MSNYAYLERYIPVVEFMGDICGKNYEIILHDVSTPERSVIAACNGHLSGRRVGDPMTELAKELIQTGAYLDHDYVANYEGRTRGGKRFVSSTFFIKEDGELRGLICVNHDISGMETVQRAVQNLMDAFHVPEKNVRAEITETLDNSIEGISSTLIRKTIAAVTNPGRPPRAEEKEAVIQTLYRRGVFNTKGAVREIADALGISEPTVYRYLHKIKTGNNGPDRTEDLP